LVLEDAHWLDDLSYDLLEAVGRDIADVPVLVLLVYRPNEQFERISKLSYFNLIALQDFDAESARKLIDLKLEQWFGDTAQVNQELIEQISQKAQGNPFYIEELVNYLRDKQIDLQSGENLNFPDTLHSLILSRVDQLMEDEKTTLKVASILGREFAFRSLLETYAPLGTPEQVRGYLDKLSKLDITPLDVPEPELIYIFKHAITQEVTYESLPYSLREFLHDQAGLYFERDMPDKYDLLAYHFGRSSNRDKQRVYFRFAAINAARAYNSRVAIEYYQRLLDLITAEEKVDIMLKLGEIWRLIGKRTEAETILDTALSLAKNLNLPTLIAQCQNDLGRFLWFKGQYDEALQLLVPSLQTYQVLNNKAGIAEAQSNLAKVYWRQGNYNSGFQNFQSALEMFRQLNDLRNVGKTLWNMGLIYQEQGNNEQAQIYFDEQMQIAESIDDKQALSEAYGSLGMYQTQRNLVLATEYFLKKYYISEEIGDSIGISYAIGNLAEVYRLLGYRDESLNCNYYRLRLALKINEKIQVVHTLLNIAIVYFDKKNYEETYRFISIGFEHARNFPMLFCYFLYYKLQLSLVTNQLEDAFIISEDLISLSAKLNNQEILFKGTIEQIKLKSLTKKITSLQALEMYQALLEVWKGSKEQGVLYLEMWRITGNEEFAEKATKLLTKLYLNNPQLEYKQFLIELGNEPEQTLPVLPILLVVHHSKGEVDKILAEI
jgi:tetratricopeptide (TPR) repeat protein